EADSLRWEQNSQCEDRQLLRTHEREARKHAKPRIVAELCGEPCELGPRESSACSSSPTAARSPAASDCDEETRQVAEYKPTGGRAERETRCDSRRYDYTALSYIEFRQHTEGA